MFLAMKIMNLNGSCTYWVVILLALLFRSQVYAVEQLEKNYIEWDDLTVDDQNNKGLDLNLKTPSRIIVVDKNGGGDSVTVQGAVDLVPEQNHLRHKIYILPGIYRYFLHGYVTINFSKIHACFCNCVFSWARFAFRYFFPPVEAQKLFHFLFKNCHCIFLKYICMQQESWTWVVVVEEVTRIVN